MENTTRHQMPYIMPAQAQKHVTHNEALRILDGLVNLHIVEFGKNTPPDDPLEGQSYGIGDTPTDAFENMAGQIATWADGAWLFSKPFEGLVAYCSSDESLHVFNGTHWTKPTGEVPDLSTSLETKRLGINTQPEENRLSVKADSVLFSHDDVTPGDGDVRIHVNRAQSGNIASFQFSTDYQVSGEFGLIGNNTLGIKTSEDGASFDTSLSVNTVTGNIGIGSDATSDRLAIRKDHGSTTQMGISNYADTPSASSSTRLNTADGFYSISQLYRSGVAYSITNANLIMGTYSARPFSLRTNTADRMTIHPDGRISVNTSTPSAQLSVNGAARVGSFSKTSLPDAATNGAGAIIFVNDDANGPVLAFSDGAVWRRSTDRQTVT